MIKKVLFLVFVPTLIAAFVLFALFYKQINKSLEGNNGGVNNTKKGATTYEECVAEGNPMIMIYPGQCTAENGITFVQDVGNSLEKADKISVNSPQPGQKVTNPLLINGLARGTWFFEASFPITIEDDNGNTLVTVVAQATDEWMTEEFVPFTATATFTKPNTPKGKIIFHKDNPSGLPENEDSMFIPITF